MNPAIKEVPLPKYIAIEGPIVSVRLLLQIKSLKLLITMLFLNNLQKILS